MNCAKCGKKLGKYAESNLCLKCKNPKTTTRKTTQRVRKKTTICACGKPVEPNSPLAKCEQCRKEYEYNKVRSEGKTCSVCGTPIVNRSTTGKCRACWLKSEKEIVNPFNRFIPTERKQHTTKDIKS